MAGCQWKGYNDGIEAHLAKEHPSFPVKKMDGSDIMKWEVNPENISEGGNGIIHKGMFYIIRWNVTTNDEEYNANEVHFSLESFGAKQKTDFILKFVDGDTKREYILKANTYERKSGMLKERAHLSIPQGDSKNRYLTLEFLEEK